jgi:hypothetical protein
MHAIMARWAYEQVHQLLKDELGQLFIKQLVLL